MSLLLIALVSAAHSGSAEVLEEFAPNKWSVTLPSDLCPGGVHTNCHSGSPTLADLNGDGFQDVVAVTNMGYVAAIRHDGVLLWQTDIAPSFGMAPGTHEIHSSPAVGDIDNDGSPEIAVGSGTIRHETCTQGGVIVLDHNGNVEPGWPIISYDGYVPPEGCAETVIASPSLGDLDNDGDMEVVAAGFDKRIYAWHHDGTLLPGFPPDSYHSRRFPSWPNLYGLLADDVWSSASLADLDGDGYLDIVTGTGEGNFDARYGGDANGWFCPYESPPDDGSPGYCGGGIYAFNRFGERLPGYPRYFLESMVSSVAVADVDENGDYEMFIGFSDYYYNLSPDHPTYGFRLLGLDHQANDLPGWEGGKHMGGVAMMSPAIGDIAGDDGLEIVTIAGDRKLYAWHFDGTPVAGFPMTPLDMWGGSPVRFHYYTGLVLADFDGDPKMEIFFNQSWSTNIVDGNGQQLTNTNYPNGSAPLFYSDGVLVNTPAVGDIDNDDQLEMVVTNSTARAWDLNSSTNEADWPMFRRDPLHHGRMPRRANIKVAPEQLLMLHDEEDNGQVMGAVVVQNPRGAPFHWTATSPGNVSISPTSGTLHAGDSASMSIIADAAGLNNGLHNLGEISFEASLFSEEGERGYASVPVSVLVGQVFEYPFTIISKW